MYTILLVDDEASVTEALRSSIPWTNLGVEKVFTASDGEQALAYFQKQPIDLLITDIKMPVMDGMSLLKHIRSKYPDTHCILLTAFSEFEYARTALRLGVENYLLKPIQMKEVIETIENAIDNMSIHRENKEFLFRENVLRRWLGGAISTDELSERASMLDINIFRGTYCVIGIQKTKGDTPVSLSTYGQTCLGQLTPAYECSHVWDNSGHFLIIVGGSEINPDHILSVFEGTARKLNIESMLHLVISNVTDSSDNLHILYQEVCFLLKQPDAFTQSFIRKCADLTLSADALIPDIDYQNLSPIIQKAIDYIHNGYPQSASIKEFCANHTMTTAYIGYLFKKETNVFFNNYLNNYRIAKAIEMLAGTSYKINEIAAKTGFSSTSYFILSFRKITGMTPQKYREQSK